MSSVLSASAKGASYLILVQVVSRGLTFMLNQALLRFLSPDLLGAAAQLELYSISVLYFARESLRVSLQRQSGNLQAIVNASYISILLGIPLSYLFAALYAQSALAPVPYMQRSLYLYGFASIIELLVEPLFVVTQQKLQYKTRAFAETVATLARGLVTFSAAFRYFIRDEESGVLPFALGQVAFAICLLFLYYLYTIPVARAENISLYPKAIEEKARTKVQSSHARSEFILSYFSRSLIALTLNIYLQSGIKYLLTQGDSLLITMMATLPEQGAYALASNYGGLIARVLFQPIEESSRNLFAKLSISSTDAKDKASKENVRQARTTLQDILKFYNIIALISWSIGPSLAPLLLQIIAGNRWSDTVAGNVLAVYCYYIPLLALNGVTEAFVAAVASNSQLQTQSLFMGAYSFVFATAAYVFLKTLRLGAQGLVWANCTNMICRILWNIHFIKTYFATHEGMGFEFSASLPQLSSCAVSACASNALMMARKIKRRDKLLQRIVFDGLVAMAFVLILLLLERRFFMRCYSFIFPRQSSPTT